MSEQTTERSWVPLMTILASPAGAWVLIWQQHDRGWGPALIAAGAVFVVVLAVPQLAATVAAAVRPKKKRTT